MTLGIKADIIADLRQSRIRIFQEIGSSFYAEFQNIILNLFPCILTENPGKMPLADSNGFCNILQIDFMVIILGDIILALFCVAGKISRFFGICHQFCKFIKTSSVQLNHLFHCLALINLVNQIVAEALRLPLWPLL